MSAVNNDIFNILQAQHDEGSITASLSINPNSEILKGHFPRPSGSTRRVYAAGCKRGFGRCFWRYLRLKKADHLKFMSLVEPGNNQAVQLEITYRETEQGAIPSQRPDCLRVRPCASNCRTL